MKRNIFVWQLSGFALSSLCGTLLHFLYEWTGKNAVIAMFSGVNESTWEHMKLLFFSLLAFALIQRRFFKEYKTFWSVKSVGIAIGLILIPVLFYTYNGAFGKSPDWMNIAFFFISAAVPFFAEARLFKKDRLQCKAPGPALAFIFFMGLMFVIFTFVTPKIPLFRDPTTGMYGIA